MAFKYESRAPYWNQLRKFGNLQFAKLTILIPFIGYAIIFNSNVMEYLQPTESILNGSSFAEGSQTTSKVAGWRLLSFYFGLCIVALASAFYTLFCPSIVQKYESAVEYVKSVAPELSVYGMIYLEEDLGRSHPCELTELKKAEKKMHTKYSGKIPEKVDAQIRRELLSNYFFALNIRMPILRGTIAALYVVGVVIISIPSIDVFARISRLLWRTIF